MIGGMAGLGICVLALALFCNLVFGATKLRSQGLLDTSALRATLWFRPLSDTETLLVRANQLMKASGILRDLGAQDASSLVLRESVKLEKLAATLERGGPTAALRKADTLIKTNAAEDFLEQVRALYPPRVMEQMMARCPPRPPHVNAPNAPPRED